MIKYDRLICSSLHFFNRNQKKREEITKKYILKKNAICYDWCSRLKKSVHDATTTNSIYAVSLWDLNEMRYRFYTLSSHQE